MNDWEDFRNELKKIQGAKFAIKNISTGRFVCGVDGDMKKFSSMTEAKSYIARHNCSSFYQIQFLGKAVGKGE